MKILLLGYGKEGQALENYFKTHPLNGETPEIDIWQDFSPEELQQRDYSPYDIIFRSPSVPPVDTEKDPSLQVSSITKYFFDHCPCTIIGVTATKGKGTTCSLIKSLLKAHGEDVYLVGNIGEPAINVLDQLKDTSVVVYEMSSFQLWDLQTSPHIAVVGAIEPDHLNVHKDYADYKSAKANICRYQAAGDYCIYYQKNPESVKIANTSGSTHKIPYPFDLPEDIKNAIAIPGAHNVNNAMAAIAAVASYKNISLDEYLQGYKSEIIEGLQSFHGLPHRLEFVRELGKTLFYDDNFSTNAASTKVALDAFPGQKVIPIIGGRDKTGFKDLPDIYDMLDRSHIPYVVLMGESGHELASRYCEAKLRDRFLVADSLEEAVYKAYEASEHTKKTKGSAGNIVMMSPAAASFDMFENVYDRGDKFQEIVNNLQPIVINN